ncbi:MAG: acyl-CoA dehydrogenase family protein [Nocardioides sp.]|nr:acyl-CoA dehydrogenase family protein [Nocardioides sp.]
MDFHLGEELLEVQGLAQQIFADKATTDRLRAVETTESRVDDALWGELARAGLLGIAVPEEHDGAGLGLPGLCVVLEQQGRHVAPVPLWAAGVSGLLLADHGDATTRALLPGMADGSVRVTLALEEVAPATVSAPTTTAVRAGEDWLLTGEKVVVPAYDGATHVLVSATSEEGAGVFLLPTDADGLDWTATETTTRDRAGNLVLTEARATAVGTPGGPVLGSALRTATVALAAVQVGVAQGSLALAASYLSEREQFGRPLATFQAVQHQLADCYIDIDAMRVTLWQAVTSHDEPDADRAALVAKWWCDQAGLDVVHRVQHVHGGIGVDVDYPVHRYFLWGKQIASTLGGSAQALEDLGDVLAASEIAS